MGSIFEMTLSLRKAFQSLDGLDKESVTLEDLAFISTCMRDNVIEQSADSERLYKFLDLLVVAMFNAKKGVKP